MKSPLDLVQSLLDQVTSLPLWPMPAAATLTQVKLVGHRGDPSFARCQENTLAAFAICQTHKVWAVEMDLRWTKDDQPIILHDANGARVFGLPELIPQKLDLAEVKKLVPQIPSLGEVISLLTPQTHLMLEIKEPLNRHREKILAEHLRQLSARTHYHLLTLDPFLLNDLLLFDKTSFVYVAELNLRSASQFVLKHSWGGIAGHYALMTQKMVHAHHQLGQQVGIGYAASPNSLCREIYRQVDWIFSNNSVNLQSWLNHLPGC